MNLSVNIFNKFIKIRVTFKALRSKIILKFEKNHQIILNLSI